MTRLGTTARRSFALSVFAALLSASASAGLASGQEREARARSARPPVEAEAEPDAPETGDEVDAESREVSEGGEKVKAIRFSGLDVSGRLKSPQLLHFLNRLRAEFDRPRLPHRSFVPELERSARSKSF